MKKLFEQPVVEMIRLTNEPVMTAGSGGGTGTPGTYEGSEFQLPEEG